MPAFLRFGLAAVSGWLVYLSYEPIGHWWAAVLGIALLWLTLIPWPRRATEALGMAGETQERPSVRFGALIGFTHGLFCYLFLLPWVGEFVGAMPYIALAITMALYALATGAFGVLVARWRVGAFAFPLVYLAVEFVRSSWPFGGFAWVRLAWGQINGPLAALSAWGGPALVTVAAAFIAVGCISLLDATSRRPAAAAIILPLAAGLIANLGVGKDSSTVGEAGVGAVQGNVPRMGLDFNEQRRAVLSNHVNETLRLAEEAKESGEKLDMVFWPENASDVNPFVDAEAEALVGAAVRGVDTPLLVGTLTRDEVGARNTMVVFDPETGPGERHDKRFLQPFGEYMPMRDFFRNFSDLVDLAGDFKPGDDNGVVHMGGIPVGVATCYEVAEDEAYRMAVRGGAQILSTPTNNATFGFTDMTYQQLAMSRMRAIETDRAVVVVATSGVSAIVHPDGRVSQQTEIFEPAHLMETLPLRTGTTPAVRFGQILEWLLVAAGAALMVAAAVSSRRSGRGYAPTGEQQRKYEEN
ncbi:apolipoprotein N-acyltransferase [Corynebacterium sp. HMSC05H05]|uniref:apolipoprotein N-acyltransferase n=1 Tax=Corynebacterium sp. HMSC05H05 TaxID=1581119 RepID=UPI0008A53888|nr:apolipoprotein N-acyltransferase [Corynebacterium sp. HMSC05H05]OFT58431.1 apolipoprotein N-acyltransferase [Corynebacterium sp. HMSC05H05]